MFHYIHYNFLVPSHHRVNENICIIKRHTVNLFAIYQSSQAFRIQKGRIYSLQDTCFIKQSVNFSFLTLVYFFLFQLIFSDWLKASKVNYFGIPFIEYFKKNFQNLEIYIQNIKKLEDLFINAHKYTYTHVNSDNCSCILISTILKLETSLDVIMNYNSSLPIPSTFIRNSCFDS